MPECLVSADRRAPTTNWRLFTLDHYSFNPGFSAASS